MKSLLQNQIKMKLKQCLLIVVVLLVFTPTTNAQFGKLKKRVQNRIDQKINQKINQEVDKAVDKAVESILDQEVDKAVDKAVESILEKKGYDLNEIGYETYDLSGSYSYQFKIDWEITSEKDDPMQMTQLISEDGKHFAMEFHNQNRKEDEKGVFIYDIENSEMIILVEAEKQAIITAMDIAEDVIEETYEEENNFSWTRTGKKKQLLGHTCYQYKYSSDDGKGEVWITKDLKYSNYDLYSYMQQTSKRKKKHTMPASWEKLKDGFALESINISNDGKEVRMLVKSIDENANVEINVDGYQAMKITGKIESRKE